VILADTSIVIDFLRTASPKLRHLIATEPAAVCGVTRAEVLHGARDPVHRLRLLTALTLLAQLPIPEPLWDSVGDNAAELRRNGVTVPFADVIIATVAIGNGVELWARDNQFQHIQRVLPALRLYVEPP
jgi:predicted nucleic acid-binding protein